MPSTLNPQPPTAFNLPACKSQYHALLHYVVPYATLYYSYSYSYSYCYPYSYFYYVNKFFMKKALAQEDLEAPPGQAGTEDELKQAS